MESDPSYSVWSVHEVAKKTGPNKNPIDGAGLPKFEREAGFIKDWLHLMDFHKSSHLRAILCIKTKPIP